jgi:lipoyl(octanoyl) transferase
MSIPNNKPAGLEAADRLPVFDLGVAPYQPVQRLQCRLRTAVADEYLPGVVLLLEHEPVITLGNRCTAADLQDPALIRSRAMPVVPTERGGQATLHAPGQLVVYPIVPIPRRDLRGYVHDLEEVFVLMLADLDIAAHRREGRPGLYVQGDKIMSVGLRCHRWVASHGASFNVSVDLSLFDLVVSCGERSLRQTSLRAITGRSYRMEQIKSAYLEAFRRVFDWELAPLRTLPYECVEQTLGLRRQVPTAGFEPATPGSGGQCSIP